MKKYTQSIIDVCTIEDKLGLYDIWASGFPIWRLVYRKYRDRYIQMHSGVEPMHTNPKFNIRHIIESTLKSFCQYIRLLMWPKKAEFVFYGFPRLEKIDEIYVDKFCDPIIQQTEIKHSYLYIERGRSGIHQQPRCDTNILWIEFIDNLALLFSPVYSLYFKYKYNSEFSKIYSLAKDTFNLTKADINYIANSFSLNYIKRGLIKRLLKAIEARYIFATAMNNWPSLISASRQLNICCFEIQHGITEGPTPMYSGKYLEDFSPDLFLAFGATSMKPLFNVPIDKMLNIGFGFKNLIKNRDVVQEANHYLIVSDPEITESIIKVALQLKSRFVNTRFSIRFHPMEYPTNSQLSLLRNSGIAIDSNKVNSSVSVLKYSGVIGEKSSVLYEALSLGIKAAKLSFDGLNPGIDVSKEISKGFFVAQYLEDIDNFILDNFNFQDAPEYYSDFNIEFINKLTQK